MDARPSLLICDNDNLLHLAVKQSLKLECELHSAYDCDEAIELLRERRFDALLLDVEIRTPTEGLDYIPKFKEIAPELDVVMISGRTDFKTVRNALKKGATDYIAKDFDPDEIRHVMRLVLERRRLIERSEQHHFETLEYQKKFPIIGTSPTINAIRKVVERLRLHPGHVLITGETGTGKEAIARNLRGTLKEGSLAPFVAVDSSTILSSMAEGLLFGYEKGSFTGATKTAKCLFEEADGGIVYFDEIGNMPLEIQAKLLRVIQEKEIVRLGSTRPKKLEFRVVAATNRNLVQMCEQGQFKADLFQRLNVIPIQVPSLKDRRDDIPELFRYYAEIHPSTYGPLQLTAEALDVLKNYSWPGNVRELVNTLLYLSAMLDRVLVEPADLPPHIRTEALGSQSDPKSKAGATGFYALVAQYEKTVLQDSYKTNAGNISQMAIKLEMDRSHLYSKLKEYGIHGAK